MAARHTATFQPTKSRLTTHIHVKHTFLASNVFRTVGVWIVTTALWDVVAWTTPFVPSTVPGTVHSRNQICCTPPRSVGWCCFSLPPEFQSHPAPCPDIERPIACSNETLVPLQILQEDVNHCYLVVNKPASVVCHHSEWTGLRAKSDNGMPVQIPVLQRIRDQTGRRVNLVHRLDRGASGCLLLTYADVAPMERVVSETRTCATDHTVMNSTAATAMLIQAMAHSNCTKTYVALVRGEGILHGVDLKQEGWFLVDRPIANERGVVKNATTWLRFVAGQDNGAGTLDRARATLVLARPMTGRWHQIRKHLNGLSHPILGDSTHGSSQTNREWRTQRGLLPERTCLHLARLQIGPTPLCPSGIDVTCPLAPDMMQMLNDHLPAVLAEAEPILREEGIQL